MVTLFEIIAIFVIFFTVSYLAYYITEERGLPRVCLTFWSLTTIYTSIWLSFQCLVIGMGGILLAIMNAIAMLIDQKQRTVSIDDYDKIVGK